MFRDTSDSMGDVEELKLEDDVVNQLRMELQRMRYHLPETTRMGDWDIGYLARN